MLLFLISALRSLHSSAHPARPARPGLTGDAGWLRSVCLPGCSEPRKAGCFLVGADVTQSQPRDAPCPPYDGLVACGVMTSWGTQNPGMWSLVVTWLLGVPWPRALSSQVQ